MNITEDIELQGTDKKLPYVIVGDKAFPLKRYLSRPYPANKIGGDKSQQKQFDCTLS
ncbi:hypothetical protein Cfor_00584 [Coptotermes formosanus]|uniref:DDE Tnp4 domain-containing protein n=1 Tax=Coptotermes formosanus TaxID=36987 RepID=A0A6L2PJ47_COPFO|nr:hypothetical protein Cfor_00584 [Coptotermes formosanus]